SLCSKRPTSCMKRYVTLYLPPILGVIIIIVKLPEFDKWIRDQSPNAPFYIVSVLAISTISIHLINIVSPFKKYERLEHNKWVLIDRLTSHILGGSIIEGYTVRANIMIPKIAVFCRLEPPKNTNNLKNLWDCIWVKRLSPI